MAHGFLVEFTEDGKRKRENVDIGNFDGNREEAERTVQRIWAGALPGRTDVKVLAILGAGVIQGAPNPPASAVPTPGDDDRIARNIAAAERNK